MSELQGCTMRGNDRQCRLVAGPSGLCHRHKLFVETFGARRAQRIEYGVRCETCGQVEEESSVADCEDCDTDDVCLTCRRNKSCCNDEARKLEEEADDLEEEANQKRAQANRVRRERKAKVAA